MDAIGGDIVSPLATKEELRVGAVLMWEADGTTIEGAGVRAPLRTKNKKHTRGGYTYVEACATLIYCHGIRPFRLKNQPSKSRCI